MTVTYRSDLCSKDEWRSLSGDRAALRAGGLSDGDIRSLDLSFPGWCLSLREYNWNEQANLLTEFVRAEGRMPSDGATCPDEKRLAQWIGFQRKQAKKKPPSFTPERRAYLDACVSFGVKSGRKSGTRERIFEVRETPSRE